MTSRAVWLSVVVFAAGCKNEGHIPRGAATTPPGGSAKEIAGTWHRVLLTTDENANDKLDDAERKPLGMDFGYTVLEIRADGTCDLQKTKRKGKGTCAVVDSDGKPHVEITPSLADSGELDEWHHRILARSEKELVLKDPTGPQGAIYAFERK
jgi:hypothetical protein